MNNAIAIAGIHTGIGKTITSAVLTEALGADYWKPVQSGASERDTLMVRSLLTDGTKRVHDEAVLLTEPLSPHAAATIDGITVDFTSFAWPETDKLLIVETAGGVLSPMTDTATMADFILHYHLPTILVTQNYLGSINHTLLSIEALRSRGIAVLGLIVNREPNEQSESFIETYGKVQILGRVPLFPQLTCDAVHAAAADLKQANITEWLPLKNATAK